jgi:hypothetical protein
MLVGRRHDAEPAALRTGPVGQPTAVIAAADSRTAFKNRPA